MKKMKVFAMSLLIMISSSGLFAQGFSKFYRTDIGLILQDIKPVAGNCFMVYGNQGAGVSIPHLLKIDYRGNVLWEKSYTHADTAFTTGVAVQEAHDHGFFLTGFGYSYGARITSHPYLIKTDAAGNEQWHCIIPVDTQAIGNDVVELSDGSVIVAGQTGSIANHGFMAKISPTGALLWNHSYVHPYGNSSFSNAMKLPNDELITTGYVDSSGRALGLITKIDADGGLISNTTYSGSIYSAQFIDAYMQHDGNILLASKVGEDRALLRADTSGNIYWSHVYHDTVSGFVNQIFEVQENADGTLNFVFDSLPPGASSSVQVLSKTDASGNVIWSKTLKSTNILNPGNLCTVSDGGAAFCGFYYDAVSSNYKGQVIRTNAFGELYSNTIHGNLFADFNHNCLLDGSEPGIGYNVVLLEGMDTTYTLTDSLGNFTFDVDTGDYTIAGSPGYYINTSTCTTWDHVSIHSLHTDTSIIHPMIATNICAMMNVDIVLGRLVACRPTYASIHYNNSGLSSADSAYVIVSIDSSIIVDSANRAYSTLSDGSLRFNIGNQAPFSSGSIYIYIHPACTADIALRTLCAEAHIYPDSLCTPPDTSWDGAHLDFTVTCDTTLDSLTFRLANAGHGTMDASKTLTIIEDNIMFMSSPISLPAGSSFNVRVPANGATWRAIISQTDYHPLTTFTTRAIEACRRAGIPFHAGFITEYPEDEESPFVAVDCKLVRAAHDPNEKIASPEGATSEHFTSANQRMEYSIYFQNNGNDTAYNIMVLDTISPYLDMSSIKLGASSAACNMSISGNNLVQFYFPDIKLVDSATNEPKSHGFVQFSINQKANNPIGTVINNKAGIYFDIYEPVYTNTAHNKIGNIYISGLENVKGKDNYSLAVYPNPFHDEALIQLQGITDGKVTVNLLGLNGQLVHSYEQAANEQLMISGRGLSPGVYILSLEYKGERIGTAKMMVY
jgi:uncharacterized repeat protein (TIGR01451 family)